MSGRRKLFAAAAPVAAAGDDAELLSLLSEFDGWEHRYQATYNGAHTVEAEDAGESARNFCHAEQAKLIDRICALHAVTLDGMRARARTLLLWAPLDEGPAEEVAAASGYPFDWRMRAALLRDLTEETAA